MKYATIVVDPPWPFAVWSEKGMGRSPKYETLAWQRIIGLGDTLQSIAADDCALCVWACRPSQHIALHIIEKHWGFTYKTELFTWVKTTSTGKPAFGLGYYTRANTEPVFLFTKGKPKRQSRSIPQVILAPRRAHSEKPEEAQDRIERLFIGPYCELFARRRREGWDCFGDHLDGKDIQIAIREHLEKYEH